MGPHDLTTRGCLSRVLYFLTWESSLKTHANGGAVIAWRTVATAVPMFALALLVKNVIDPAVLKPPVVDSARTEIANHLHWLGAILTGIYVALYTRFAA